MVDRADKDPDAARHLRKILDAFLTKPPSARSRGPEIVVLTAFPSRV